MPNHKTPYESRPFFQRNDWSAIDAARVCKMVGGEMFISRRYRDERRRLAASNAIKKGWLRAIGHKDGDKSLC